MEQVLFWGGGVFFGYLPAVSSDSKKKKVVFAGKSSFLVMSTNPPEKLII